MKYIIDFLFNLLEAAAIVFGGIALFEYVMREAGAVL